MPRPILDEAHIHPAIRGEIAEHQQAIWEEVRSALQRKEGVVIGMGMKSLSGQGAASARMEPSTGRWADLAARDARADVSVHVEGCALAATHSRLSLSSYQREGGFC